MTPIARWRARMGYSQREAAAALGWSLSAYQAHERGRNWRTGEPVRDSLVLRLACAALERKIDADLTLLNQGFTVMAEGQG